jgi:hypothetical protein
MPRLLAAHRAMAGVWGRKITRDFDFDIAAQTGRVMHGFGP